MLGLLRHPPEQIPLETRQELCKRLRLFLFVDFPSIPIDLYGYNFLGLVFGEHDSKIANAQFE